MNIFATKYFSPSGVQLSGVSTYFMDGNNDIEWAGELMTNASYNTNFHILYDGNGDYTIALQMGYGGKTEIKIPVNT